MSEDPYQSNESVRLKREPRTMLQIVAYVLSWLGWVASLVYWLMASVVRGFTDFIFPDSTATEGDALLVFCGVGCIALCSLFVFIRWFFWLRTRKTAKWGFFYLVFPFYLSLFCAVLGPYLNFMIFHQRDWLFLIGFVPTAVLVALAFPRLPKRKEEFGS